MRIRAKVAYDGTEFAGFQKQAGVRTVQGELEAALKRVCERPITVSGAGRTDTGVHASGQVIAFDVEWVHGLERLTQALNVNLPEDVAVRDLDECGPSFHPRFSALSRVYVYNALVSPTRDPVRRRYVWHLTDMPDVTRMNEAARRLVGSHDFAAFGSAPLGLAGSAGRRRDLSDSDSPDRDNDDDSGRSGRAKGGTTVRDVKRAEWVTAADGLMFTVEANAFLYRMVRRMVMALIRVGRGQLSPVELAQILESKDSQRLKGLAPACGLCLVDVKYA